MDEQTETDYTPKRVVCRVMFQDPPKAIAGVPFADVAGEGEGPCLVSAPVEDQDTFERFCKLGYQPIGEDDAFFDLDAVDAEIERQREASVTKVNSDKLTIDGLEGANRQMSADLVAARQRIEQLEEKLLGGGAGKEIKSLKTRIAELEAAGGPDEETTARAIEAEAKAQLLVGEIGRIAGLNQGFKKALEDLLAAVGELPTPTETVTPAEGD